MQGFKNLKNKFCMMKQLLGTSQFACRINKNGQSSFYSSWLEWEV